MKHRRQVASVPSKGQIPRCPLSADSRHWSLLSTSPRGTWGAPEGAKCRQCHKAMNPALTEEWHAGAHGQKGVNCYDCHRAEKTDVDAFEHNGATISVIVSP
jgi:hypothetical protein